jgi:general stress protein YciG
MAGNSESRGFASMDKDELSEIARKGGKASSAKQDMSKLGKKGAKAQPIEAKRLGGEHSHQNQQ